MYIASTGVIAHKPSASSVQLFSPKNQNTKKPTSSANMTANDDATVDAIFRLTRTLPVDFARAGAIVALAPGVYSPWNAQATLWRGSALWGSLLSITVPGRVSDIWRSYVVERLLWEVDRTVAFVSPFVTQYRNAHSYMKDFAEESDLYVKTTPLLAVLSGWTSPARSASLADAFIDIYHHLHRADIVGRLDVEVARAWVADLNASGYRWPTIDTAQPAKVLPTAPVVDERRNDLKLMHEPRAADPRTPRAPLDSWARSAVRGGTVRCEIIPNEKKFLNFLFFLCGELPSSQLRRRRDFLRNDHDVACWSSYLL